MPNVTYVICLIKYYFRSHTKFMGIIEACMYLNIHTRVRVFVCLLYWHCVHSLACPNVDNEEFMIQRITFQRSQSTESSATSLNPLMCN